MSVEKNAECNHLSHCFIKLNNKYKVKNKDNVGIIFYTQLTTYSVIRKNRSNNDKRSVS